MNRAQLNTAVPMLYAILIVASLLFFRGAFLAIIIIGAMLIGLYYALAARSGGVGRDRQRNRR